MCEKLVRDFGFVHLSAGELLRAAQANAESEIGKLIKSYINEGKIVPVKITVDLLRGEMETGLKQASPKTRYLVDGFPRNADNYEGWNEMMTGFAKVEFVLFLDCPENVMEKRCLIRADEELKKDPKKVRSDDNVETIRKRVRTYAESTKPIIELFDGKGMVKKIDATPSADDVYTVVKSTFAEYFTTTSN